MLVLEIFSYCITIFPNLTLQTHTPRRESKGPVNLIRWSHHGEYFATADSDRCVGIFKLQAEKFAEPWLFVGKYRSHSKWITDLLFYRDASKNERLVSIGEVGLALA